MRQSIPRAAVVAAMLLVALLAGFAMGRASGNGAALGAAASPAAGGVPGFDATATRVAETIELSQLQTRVAQTPAPVICTAPVTSTPTPNPTPSPTPTLVPPSGAGTPLPYTGGWTVSARDVTYLPTFANVSPTGVFAQVALTITNNTAAARAFPYFDLVLRDVKGRTFIPSFQASIQNNAGLYTPFSPNLPSDGFAIFDIAKDATGPFILESKTDPTFRVTVDVEKRG